MKYFLIIFLISIISSASFSQDSVSTPPAAPVKKAKLYKKPALKPVKSPTVIKDTLQAATDTSGLKEPVKEQKVDTTYYKLLRNPYLPGRDNALYFIIKEREPSSKDELFYIVAGLMVFIAFTKLMFPKYFQNIFRLFFQPQFRQKQTREQLLQNNLPSLLFNLFFILSGGVYVALITQYYNVIDIDFGFLFLYATVALAILYLSKYIIVHFSGWVFNVKEASGTYVFVVYLINKIIGIVLIPFILILAFSNKELADVSITVSLLLVMILFLYRYFISYAPVRRDIKVSAFHFLLYIFAFEITPLLLIYKLLANYLHRSL